MRERSLVVFTILSQLTVGRILDAHPGLWVDRLACGMETGVRPDRLRLAAGERGDGGLPSLPRSSIWGLPLGAWRAVSNARQSWLSREILFAALFAGSSALFAGLHWLGWGSPVLRAALATIVGLAGLALVYAMSRAYRLRTVPTWNTWITPASFFAATFLQGALVVGLGLVVCSRYLQLPPHDAQAELIRTILQGIAAGAVILLAAELFLSSGWVVRRYSGAFKASAFEAVRKRRMLCVLRCAAIVTAIAAGAASPLSCESRLAEQGVLVVATCGFALAAEVLGRIVFYDARRRVGV